MVKKKSNPITYWCQKGSWVTKTYHVSHHYFMTTNSWMILEKRPKFKKFSEMLNVSPEHSFKGVFDKTGKSIDLIRKLRNFYRNHLFYEFINLLITHCVKCVQIRSFFWSVFSRIQTEHGEIRSISPYLVRIRENTDQKKLRIWTLFTQWLWYYLLIS